MPAGGQIQSAQQVSELEDSIAQLAKCNQYVSELQSKVDAAQTAAENAKDDLEKLKEELDEKTEQIQKFRQREMRSCHLESPSIFLLIRFRWKSTAN